LCSDFGLDLTHLRPPNVIEKTSTDGAKYFLISPKLGCGFEANGEKEKAEE
jgi:hypothetical protein